jgi:tetratricopeptide (TPR) repeat protein
MVDIHRRRGDLPSAAAAADSARFHAPDNFAAWEAKENVLVAAADTSALRVHYSEALDRFRREEDLRVRYQARLADLERDGGDGQTAREIEARMIRENRRQRTDLSAATGGEILSRLMQEGDYEAAMREYRSLTGKIGATGGGNFFYGVVRPFVLQLQSGGRVKDARRALDLAGRVMRFESGSILAREFDELQAGLATSQ